MLERFAHAVLALFMSCASAHALDVWSDTRLEPGRVYDPIVIRASGVTLDGEGATIVGPGHGAGILAQDVSDVTVRAVTVRDVDVGCQLIRAPRATVRGGDFSGARVAGVAVTRSPRATLEANRANGCGHGILLAGADGAALIANEASDNAGDGIAARRGGALHVTLRGNRCARNAGAGIAAAGDREGRFPVGHWIVERNELAQNAAGVYLSRTAWVDLGSNRFCGNGEDVRQGPDVAELLVRPDAPPALPPPVASLAGGAAPAVAARPVSFDASTSVDPSGRPLAFRWEMGDGTVLAGPRARHVYARPGVHRVGLTVTNGLLCAMQWRDVQVIDRGLEVGTGGGTAPWDATASAPGTGVTFAVDEAVRLVGTTSLRASVDPYAGGEVSLVYPENRQMGIPFSRWLRVELWMRAGDATAGRLAAASPVIALHETATRAVILTPGQPLFDEPREAWSYLTVPAAGDELWQRSGDDIATVNWVTFTLSARGREPLSVWLDGLGFGGRHSRGTADPAPGQ